MSKHVLIYSCTLKDTHDWRSGCGSYQPLPPVSSWWQSSSPALCSLHPGWACYLQESSGCKAPRYASRRLLKVTEWRLRGAGLLDRHHEETGGGAGRGHAPTSGHMYPWVYNYRQCMLWHLASLLLWRWMTRASSRNVSKLFSDHEVYTKNLPFYSTATTERCHYTYLNIPYHNFPNDSLLELFQSLKESDKWAMASTEKNPWPFTSMDGSGWLKMSE